MRGFKKAWLLGILVPVLLFAHETDDALGAQIRADLLKDPRAAQMTEVEFDTLVHSLRDKVELEGSAADYMDSQNSFSQTSLFEMPRDTARTLVSPLGLALVFFLIILAAVIWYIRTGMKKGNGVADGLA